MEVGMRLHLDLDHQVTSLANGAEVAFLAHSQVDSCVDSLRNVDGLLNRGKDCTLPSAGPIEA